MNKTLKKIKSFVKALWFKFVTNPIQERLKLRVKLKQQKIEKAKFEKTHSVDLDRVKDLMFTKTKDIKQAFLDEELIKGAKHTNSFKNYTAPSFYEPEICDIHNENPDRESYPPIRDIMSKDVSVTNTLLSEQSKAKNLKLRDKGRFLWLTRE